MLKLNTSICVLLIASLAVFTSACGSKRKGDSQKYGTQLVAEYTLEDAFIDKIDKSKPAAKNPKLSALENYLSTDTVDWRGPELTLPTNKNPYTLVIKVDGQVPQDGNTLSMWNMGWWVEDKGHLNPVMVALTDAKARNGLALEVAGKPVSFTENRTVVPAVSFVKADNQQISKVTLQVWSGMAKTTWMQYFSAFQMLLIPVIMFVIALYFRRK